MSPPKKGIVNLLQEFSIPLIVGVVVAMLAANLNTEGYLFLVGGVHGQEAWLPFGDLHVFGHQVDLFFLVNDIFMVFFFGIAAKEITEAALPGGSLNPIKKAINPLISTLGGVIGPVGVFFAALWASMQLGYFEEGADVGVLMRGWGVPTATDIALAWLVARAVFGTGHPAVNFLLLLAVADDAIGLGIIAVFYGDPHNPVKPAMLLLVLLAMGVAWGLRRAGVKHWVPYILIAGPIAWCGLVLAHLHPALALVFIVPFLPGPRRDIGLFTETDEIDRMGDPLAADLFMDHSPLHQFERQLKVFVDFGLFFFAFSNAGVPLAKIGPMTWIILLSLAVGKTLGITAFGLIGKMMGFPLPDRVGMRQLVVAAFIAGLGLTVALFVAGAAFTEPGLRGQAKMGALFSGVIGFLALALGRALRVRQDP